MYPSNWMEVAWVFRLLIWARSPVSIQSINGYGRDTRKHADVFFVLTNMGTDRRENHDGHANHNKRNQTFHVAFSE